MQKTSVAVKLGSRSYKVLIRRGLLDEAGPLAREVLGESARRVVVVTNASVGGLYGRRVLRSLRRVGFDASEFRVGDGERFKSLRVAESVFDYLITRRLERDDAIVALGGGVVGDLAGFTAATYLRGIRFVQIPTTLLAQIDSSVGGKTAVNHRLGKNLIGAFHQPSVVIVDPATLESLPGRELRAGLYEAIKYGVIRDRRFFNRIAGRLESVREGDPFEIARLISRCCSIKADVVRQDERESGLRMILNFGHTAGHAIEAATGYRRYLHGEAVGAGMLVESLVACRMNLLGEADLSEICSVIGRVGRLPGASTLALDDIISAMDRDKKARAGRPTFVLPVTVGKVVIRSDVPLPVVKSALNDALLRRRV